jgi:hypothetical protein
MDWNGFFFAYWWLMFPLMGFLFGAFGMWMGYRAHKDRMDVIKTYAAQGKDPAEIAKVMGGPGFGDPYGGPYGSYRWGGWGYGWGPWGRYGPYREWRRFILFLCLAIGFGFASQFPDYGPAHAFSLVAVIMGVLALGSFCFAVVSTLIMISSRKNEK